jgi:outer membrane protein TolC
MGQARFTLVQARNALTQARNALIQARNALIQARFVADETWSGIGEVGCVDV